MLTINKYCRINNNECLIDGKTVFENHDVSLKQFLTNLYRFLGMDYMKFFKMDALSKSGLLTSEILFNGVHIEGKKTGLFFANSYSSLDTDIHYQQTIGKDYFPSPAVFVYTLPNIVLGEIAIRYKLYGENLFLVGRNWQSSQLIPYVNQAFAESDLQKALVGWLDCYKDDCDVFVMLVERDGNNTLELTETNVKQLIIKRT